jgi:Fe-S cluster biogenesis protein NfuA/nitrite reductase/ring-hydroxylating ferredoxin subunit
VEFDRAVAELATLVDTLEREGDERGLELLRLVDEVHRPALEALARGDVDDPRAQALLGAYGLGAAGDRFLAEAALDEIRPYIHSHGGEVELLDVADGVVHVRLAGSCVGCAGSAVTLRRGVEEALRSRYPGFVELRAEEAAPLVQLGSLRRPVFVDARVAPEPGTLEAVEADGVSVVLANVAGEVYAFRNGCAVDGRPLDGGRLTGSVLVCPWHNCAYDARSGKRADGEDGPALAVVPVAQDGEGVRIAVNVA